jgi:hypothetical protein
VLGVLPMHFILSFCTNNSSKYFIFTGRFFSHPTHKDEILDSVRVRFDASTWANQTQSCFFYYPFFCECGTCCKVETQFHPT